MTARHVRRLLPALGILYLLGSGCAKAPPELTPPAQQAFYKTHVLKGLDLLRDFAIDAEATTPKVLSTSATRVVVQYHQSAVKVMQAADSGWQAVVLSSLDETLLRLPAGDRQKVAPYAALVKSVIQEIH